MADNRKHYDNYNFTHGGWSLGVNNMKKTKKSKKYLIYLLPLLVIVTIFIVVQPFSIIGGTNSFSIGFSTESELYQKISDYTFSIEKPKIVCPTTDEDLDDRYHVHYSGTYAELDKNCWEFIIHYKDKSWEIKDNQKIMLDDYLQVELDVGDIIYNVVEKNKDLWSVVFNFEFVNTNFITASIVEETRYVELGDSIVYNIVVNNNYGNFGGGLYATQQNMFGDLVQQDISKDIKFGSTEFEVTILPNELGKVKVEFVPYFEVSGSEMSIPDLKIHTETQVVAVGSRIVEEQPDVPELVIIDPDTTESEGIFEKIINWFKNLFGGDS